jgi:hypothetical protein
VSVQQATIFFSMLDMDIRANFVPLSKQLSVLATREWRLVRNNPPALVGRMMRFVMIGKHT